MGWLSNIIGGVANTVGSIFGGPVGAIADGIGSIIGNQSAENQHAADKAWASAEAQKNRDFQVDERLASQEWNEMMWHKNNEYNSPVNQLRLYQEAGINPNAIFGNLNGTSKGSPSTAAMSGASAPSVPSFANSMLGLNPEMRQMLANVRKTEAEAEGQEIANDAAPKFNEAMLQKAVAETDAAAAKAGLDKEQANQIKELLPYLKDKNEAEIKKMGEELKVLTEQISLVKSQQQSTERDAEMKRLDLEFRNKFGVSPNSGLVDGIIQLIGAGDKGSAIVDSLLSTLVNIAVGLFTGQFLGPVKVIEKISGN